MTERGHIPRDGDTNMKRYEYKIEDLGGSGITGDGQGVQFLVERLNARGGSGWQLVSILHSAMWGTATFYVFVREIQEAKPELE